MVEERSIKITGAKVSTDRVTAGFDADTGDLPRFYAHIHALLTGVFPSLKHPHMAAFVAEHAQPLNYHPRHHRHSPKNTHRTLLKYLEVNCKKHNKQRLLLRKASNG